MKARCFKYEITKNFRYLSDSLFLADTTGTAKDYFEASAGQFKQQWSIQVTIGVHLDLGKRMEFEAQAAVGVGYRHLANRTLEPLPGDTRGPYFGQAIRLYALNAPGHGWRPVISLHAKIGFNWGEAKRRSTL